MAEQLGGIGVSHAGDGSAPDLVIVNTCTVTREATKASRMAIRRAVKANPQARIAVVGCYAVSDPEEIASIEGVDLILGNVEKENIGSALGLQAQPLLQIGLGSRRLETPRVRANLKVQTGCDEWCSFCIIPTTRGELRSFDADQLVEEARRRVRAGTREIVLTGVHLGKYSFDEGGDERRLIALLRRLLDIDGLWRIRLSSILSQHLTDELLEFMGAEPRICRFLHVPLQSGDASVLKAMNRPYRIGDYLARVESAVSALPDLALATDIIVGFPGETEEAFEATMDVVRRIRFSKLHVFRYSARPGTAAASMPDVIPPEVKKDRSKRLIDLGNEIRRDFLQRHVGRPLDVLVEDERIIDGVGVCSGQTDDYVRVWFEGSGLLGTMARVEGVGTRADGLSGQLVPGLR